MIDVEFEELISFAALAKRLPPGRRGQPVHPSTVHRWRCPGIRGIRLSAIRVGGYWRTSMEAFQSFCEELSAASSSEGL